MRLPAGLRARVTLLVAGVVVVCLAIGFAAVYRATVSDLTRRTDEDLRGDMAALIGGTSPAHGDRAAVAARAARFVRDQPFRNTAHVLFVVVPGRAIATNDSELATGSRAARQFRAGPPGFAFRRVPQAGRVRLLVAEYRRGGQLVARLGVGEPTAARQRAQDVLLDAFLLAGALGVAAALLGGFLVAAEVAAPLRRMARVAARVDAGDLAPRLHIRGRDDEVQVLADAFDHMLDRLQAAFTRQETFVADASHELRTPLTVIRGQLELLALDDTPDAGDVRRVERITGTEIERMTRIVDDLLLLARAGEGSFVRSQPSDLREYMTELVAGMRATTDRRLELAPVPALVIDADPDRLAQALRNVLRNAIEHTDPDGLVRVSASSNGDWVTIAIDDDDPGIPQSHRERVFARFERADASRARAEESPTAALASCSSYRSPRPCEPGDPSWNTGLGVRAQTIAAPAVRRTRCVCGPHLNKPDSTRNRPVLAPR